MSEDNVEILVCSFCGKRQDQVKKLIAGPSVYICDECIELCHAIVHEDDNPDVVGPGKTPTPREIKTFLDQYVIGQDYAKTVISVAVNNHYKRLANPIVDDVELDKSNVLLLGPTGCGKTLIAQSIARMLDVPFAIADATTLTEAGYVGDDVEAIIVRLLQIADYDVELAERGIIYVDEIDKKARRGDNASITRDVSGEGVQQALLKIIEGTICRVPPQGGRKHPNQEMIEIDTKNILFIVGGAFVGLEKIIADDKNRSSIGFGADIHMKEDVENITELLQQVEPSHLVKFGLIPEFVGRVPVHASLEELTEDQLVKVLTEPKNALTKQFQKLFGLEEVELEFLPDALVEIAKIAKERKTGARGLRSVIEKTLMQIQFDLPDKAKTGLKKVIINKECVISDNEPLLEFNGKNAAPPSTPEPATS